MVCAYSCCIVILRDNTPSCVESRQSRRFGECEHCTKGSQIRLFILFLVSVVCYFVLSFFLAAFAGSHILSSFDSFDSFIHSFRFVSLFSSVVSVLVSSSRRLCRHHRHRCCLSLNVFSSSFFLTVSFPFLFRCAFASHFARNACYSRLSAFAIWRSSLFVGMKTKCEQSGNGRHAKTQNAGKKRRQQNEWEKKRRQRRRRATNRSKCVLNPFCWRTNVDALRTRNANRTKWNTKNKAREKAEKKTLVNIDGDDDDCDSDEPKRYTFDVQAFGTKMKFEAKWAASKRATKRGEREKTCELNEWKKCVSYTMLFLCRRRQRWRRMDGRAEAAMRFQSSVDSVCAACLSASDHLTERGIQRIRRLSTDEPDVGDGEQHEQNDDGSQNDCECQFDNNKTKPAATAANDDGGGGDKNSTSKKKKMNRRLRRRRLRHEHSYTHSRAHEATRMQRARNRSFRFLV